MILPIVSIPPSIARGLSDYKDLFPRCETYQHIQEYCTGMAILEKPSIQRMSQCFVDGPCQSSLNKAITSSPWSEEAVNQRHVELIRPYHRNGFTVGILDSTFIHHPRGQSIYGVYKYWDYVERQYTYAIQLVTAAVSTNDRLDGFGYRIYHRSFERQERLYLEHTGAPDDNPNPDRLRRRLVELISYQLHKGQARTKNQLAVELIDEMESSGIAPNAYAVDSSLFAPEVIERIEKSDKPWVSDSAKTVLSIIKTSNTTVKHFRKPFPRSFSKRLLCASVVKSVHVGCIAALFAFVAMARCALPLFMITQTSMENLFMCSPRCCFGTFTRFYQCDCIVGT